VGYGNRLTAEQIAALAPGDTVAIETGADRGRPRHTTGTVVRFDRAHVVVRVEGRRGVKYVQRFGLRDGLREGGGRAELVTPGDDPASRDLVRRRTQRIDAAYRQWSRHRGDVDALRELRDAVSQQLDEVVTR
jgi:DNA-directed RNA polymerase beta' subunit